jgi:RNA polymerase sigma-70 factor (ECF subfamily)
MENDPETGRLSKIETDWDGVRAAHQDGSSREELAAARNRVLMRYDSCIRMYVLAKTKNPEVAEELSQEFALRFVKGDYKNADPSKGRFRDYLKTSVRNLVIDYFRKKAPGELTKSAAERIEDKVGSPEIGDLEIEFQQNWRRTLLSHVWDSLKRFESDRENCYYTVLHHRSQNPTASSAQMAAALSLSLGEQVTPEWVRQKIHRARRKFAELLIAEVRQSMNSTDRDEIQQELSELGLQKYL